MTSPIKTPFQIVNPVSKHFVPSLAILFIVLINIFYFGFLGPAMISAPNTMIVLGGFLLAFLDLIATLYLSIASINAILRGKN